MIEAPNNLACLQHGANPQYIKLHAQTQQELCYYLKHKYGISENYNTNQPNQPWYGMGQVAGDACNLGSDSMANAYSSGVHGWSIPSPTQTPSLWQDLKAFIDDVNLFIGQPDNKTEKEFLDMVQQDINQWHCILQATRGELNNKNASGQISNFNMMPMAPLAFVQKSPPIPNFTLQTLTEPKKYSRPHSQVMEFVTLVFTSVWKGIHKQKPKSSSSNANSSSKFTLAAHSPTEKLLWL